jgi:hypothetical protein
MENIHLEDAINAGTHYPEGTSKSHSTFIKKALFSLAMEDMFMVI